MKKIITILMMIPTLSFASQTCNTVSNAETVEEQMEIKTDVPNHLKGATIIVRTADGKESSVPAEKFKVVPRKQQFIVSKTKQLDETTCNQDLNKNRISVLAGKGAKEGLDKTVSPTEVTVKSRVGAVGGLQYQRLLPYMDNRVNVGVQATSNKTVLMNLGLDF